jgi:hypothetical protein
MKFFNWKPHWNVFKLILNILLISRVIINLFGLAGFNYGRNGEDDFDR